MAINSTGTPIVVPDTPAIFIQVNTGFTGTITVAQPNKPIAVITNPTAGQTYRYSGLRSQGNITVTPSAACDVTVSSSSKDL